MAYTADGLVKYCKDRLKDTTYYMYGAIMRSLTTAYIDDRAAAYPSHYTPERVKYLKSKVGTGYGCDCVALIKSYYWGGVGSPKYRGSTDVSANGMKQRATVWGYMNNLPERPGVLVWMDGHIGVYIGNGDVIECTSNKAFGDGVCKTKLTQRNWQAWLECPYITYEKAVMSQGVYTVQDGDTLWGIAEKYMGSGLRYDEIMALNGLKSTIIHPGQKLNIPER